MNNKTNLLIKIVFFTVIFAGTVAKTGEVTLSDMEQLGAAATGLGITYLVLNCVGVAESFKNMFLQTGVLDVLYYPAKHIGTPETSLNIINNAPEINKDR